MDWDGQKGTARTTTIPCWKSEVIPKVRVGERTALINQVRAIRPDGRATRSGIEPADDHAGRRRARPPLWRSPTSSPGSPGRCSGAAKGSSSGDCPWRPSCWSGQSRSALTDRCGLREAISRSPDSRTPLRKPGLKNGVIRRREVYEHPSAPISILAGRSPPKPDTLQQTDHRRSRIISRRRGGPYVLNASTTRSF